MRRPGFPPLKAAGRFEFPGPPGWKTLPGYSLSAKPPYKRLVARPRTTTILPTHSSPLEYVCHSPFLTFFTFTLLHFGHSLVAGSMNMGLPVHPQFSHSNFAILSLLNVKAELPRQLGERSALEALAPLGELHNLPCLLVVAEEVAHV